MKAISKIIIAGIVGTTFMTLYSRYKSEDEDEQYTEPVLLNKLIDRSGMHVKVNNNHPAGWLWHYSIGILFVTSYYVLWRKSLREPTLAKIFVVGSLSGVLAVADWELMFIINPNPPSNDRYGYYRQLFIAHLIFAGFALPTYSFLDSKDAAKRLENA